jgi:hypothetical protein
MIRLPGVGVGLVAGVDSAQPVAEVGTGEPPRERPGDGVVAGLERGEAGRGSDPGRWGSGSCAGRRRSSFLPGPATRRARAGGSDARSARRRPSAGPRRPMGRPRPPNSTRSGGPRSSSRTRTSAAGAEFAEALAGHSSLGSALTMPGVQAARPDPLRAHQRTGQGAGPGPTGRRRGQGLPGSPR